jgi:hypothetical protein
LGRTEKNNFDHFASSANLIKQRLAHLFKRLFVDAIYCVVLLDHSLGIVLFNSK